MDVWTEIKHLEGKTLRTLDRRKPFDVVGVTGNVVLVMPHETGKERPIPWESIENAYRRLVATGQLTRSDIRADFSEFNPAYVAAILAELPGVRVSLKPITLRFKNGE